MKTLAKLLWVEVKLFVREPIAVVFAFAFPLVVLLVLAGVFGSEPHADFGGVAGIDYYVPGYLAVVIASVGLIRLPVHLASLRERGILRRLRASSVSMTSVFAAQTAVHVAMAALGGAVLLFAASLVYEVHAPSSVAGVALGFAVAALSFVALGVLLGSLAPTARAAQAIGLVLFFPMWLLSGAGPPRAVMTPDDARAKRRPAADPRGHRHPAALARYRLQPLRDRGAVGPLRRRGGDRRLDQH
jgi:ABC-2 type transport system permease protein